LELESMKERYPPRLLDRRGQPLVLERETQRSRTSSGCPLVGRGLADLATVKGVPLLPRAVNDDASSPSVQFVEWTVQIDPFAPSHRLDEPCEERGLRKGRPGRHRPLAQTRSTVRHEDRRIGTLLDPQPLANGAPAQRAIERKVMRRQFIKA